MSIYPQASRSSFQTPSVHFQRDTEELTTAEDTTDSHFPHRDVDYRMSVVQHLFTSLKPEQPPDPVERDPEDLRAARTIPTTVVPLYRQRMVLLKIGDSFLRVGTGNQPVFSKCKAPLYPPISEDDVYSLLNPRGIIHRSPKKFEYKDFTFFADESASLAESWYRTARAFFHIRLAVMRRNGRSLGGNTQDGGDGELDTDYLCAIREGLDQYGVRYDQQTFGSWWRITALSNNQFVAESVQYPGRCLTKGRFGLCLSPPLTSKERHAIVRRQWDKARTITILTLPDFAASWIPGATVN